MLLHKEDFVLQTRQTFKKMQFFVQTKSFSGPSLLEVGGRIKHAPHPYKKRYFNIHPVASFII